ncbi:MAG: endonuclease/exonuclease/phosphatase family protein [Pseudomonadota bacterium]
MSEKQPVNHHALPNTLRLLTYNIQMGIETRHYRDYVTRSWRHFIHHRRRFEIINGVAALATGYDIVALQEADGGSLRSGFVNMVEYIASKSNHAHWHSQCNRNLGKLAQYSNGLLSRFPLQKVEFHRLPGFIPGRGAIRVFLGPSDNPLAIIIVHLALSGRARRHQLAYIAELCKENKHIIVMGDTNCSAEQVLFTLNDAGVHLYSHNQRISTFPSWAPRREIDHIFVSQNMSIKAVHHHRDQPSDHIPVSMEIELPSELLATKSPISHVKT